MSFMNDKTKQLIKKHEDNNLNNEFIFEDERAHQNSRTAHLKNQQYIYQDDEEEMNDILRAVGSESKVR